MLKLADDNYRTIIIDDNFGFNNRNISLYYF